MFGGKKKWMNKGPKAGDNLILHPSIVQFNRDFLFPMAY